MKKNPHTFLINGHKSSVPICLSTRVSEASFSWMNDYEGVTVFYDYLVRNNTGPPPPGFVFSTHGNPEDWLQEAPLRVRFAHHRVAHWRVSSPLLGLQSSCAALGATQIRGDSSIRPCSCKKPSWNCVRMSLGDLCLRPRVLLIASSQASFAHLQLAYYPKCTHEAISSVLD